MATIKQNLVVIAATTAIIAPVAVRFYRRWLLENKTRDWLNGFGTHEADVEDCLVEEAPAEENAQAGQIRGWRREPRGLHTKLAFVAADEAYLQFGRREKSQANDLVTRKFLRDWLRERPGLRAKDASAVIEVALSLSYVPPAEWREIAEMEVTRAYTQATNMKRSSFF